MTDVVFTAAHGGFASEQVPLGGGAAVCDHLLAEWNRTNPFPLTLLTPSVLGAQAPRGKELVSYSEWDYARFCLSFEQETTARILERDPARTVVLCNDVSEGPDFRRLAERGYRLYTIYHVDVVDYFARIYLRGWISPERVTKTFSAISGTPLARWLPKVAGLIVRKQHESVHYSKGLVVPSHAMRDVFLRCYPKVDPKKIHVLPWGVWEEEPNEGHELASAAAQLEHDFPPVAGRLELLSLSRISPEKGQDRLLKALAIWETRSDYPRHGVALTIAGEAAYMKGKVYEQSLREIASRLRRTKVFFAGFATGALKQALFKRADIYVFPSRHESYGLTAMEAMRAGKPIVACFDHGTQDIVQPDRGILLPVLPEAEISKALCEELSQLARKRDRLPAMGEAARRFALSQPFSRTAERLAALLQSDHAVRAS